MTAIRDSLAQVQGLLGRATPGPWAAIHSIPEEGWECFWLRAQPGGGICRGFTKEIGAINGPQSDEQYANARLIVEAVAFLRTHGPELMKMLEGKDGR